MLSTRITRSLWFLCFLVLFIVCVKQISRLQRFSESNDGARTRLKRQSNGLAEGETCERWNDKTKCASGLKCDFKKNTVSPDKGTCVSNITSTPPPKTTSASSTFKSASPMLLCLTSIIMTFTMPVVVSFIGEKH